MPQRIALRRAGGRLTHFRQPDSAPKPPVQPRRGAACLGIRIPAASRVSGPSPSVYADDRQLGEFLGNSVTLMCVTVVACVTISIAITNARRFGSPRIVGAANRLSAVGYAVPGPVVAMGVVVALSCRCATALGTGFSAPVCPAPWRPDRSSPLPWRMRCGSLAPATGAVEAGRCKTARGADVVGPRPRRRTGARRRTDPHAALQGEHPHRRPTGRRRRPQGTAGRLLAADRRLRPLPVWVYNLASVCGAYGRRRCLHDDIAVALVPVVVLQPPPRRRPAMTALGDSGVAKAYGALRRSRPSTWRWPTARSSALVGPSGCGKSTLLRIVAGLCRRRAAHGQDRRRRRRRRPPPGRPRAARVAWCSKSTRFRTSPSPTTSRSGSSLRARRGPRRDRALARRHRSGRPRRPVSPRTVGGRAPAARARPGARPHPRLMLLDEPFASLDPICGPTFARRSSGSAFDGNPGRVRHPRSGRGARRRRPGGRDARRKGGAVRRSRDGVPSAGDRLVASFIGEAAFVAVDDSGMTELRVGCRRRSSDRRFRRRRTTRRSCSATAASTPRSGLGVPRTEPEPPLAAAVGHRLHALQPHGVQLLPGDRVGVSLGPGAHAVLRPE